MSDDALKLSSKCVGDAMPLEDLYKTHRPMYFLRKHFLAAGVVPGAPDDVPDAPRPAASTDLRQILTPDKMKKIMANPDSWRRSPRRRPAAQEPDVTQ